MITNRFFFSLKKGSLAKLVSSFLIVTVAVISSGVSFSNVVYAASLTALSDTMSRQKISENSSHVIRFTTPSAINDSGGTNTIVITFPADFDFTGIAFGDISLSHGPTTGLENTEVVATTPSASDWGAAFSGTDSRILTLTTPTDGVGAASLIATHKVVVTYTSTNSVNPTTSGSKSITITTAVGVGNSGSDTGTLAIPIVGGTAADDQVVITATVDPTITFTNDDNAIGFGALTTSNARYANAAGTGSGSIVTANTLAVATNAASGYTLTYNGPTLTSGGNTISVATIAGDADGTPASEQFAIAGTMTGNGSMVSAYNAASNNWSFVAGTTTTLASHTAPTSDSVAMQYLANIAGTTEAGAYTTTLTYIATGNF